MINYLVEFRVQISDVIANIFHSSAVAVYCILSGEIYFPDARAVIGDEDDGVNLSTRDICTVRLFCAS